MDNKKTLYKYSLTKDLSLIKIKSRLCFLTKKEKIMNNIVRIRYLAFILFSRKKQDFEYYVLDPDISQQIIYSIAKCYSVHLSIRILRKSPTKLPFNYQKRIIELWQKELDRLSTHHPAIVSLSNMYNDESSKDLHLMIIPLNDCSSWPLWCKKYQYTCWKILILFIIISSLLYLLATLITR